MLGILSITLPVFAVIAVGYIAARFGPFPPSKMKALGDFTMLVALPCALFYAVASRDFSEVLNVSYLVVLGLGSAATQLVMWLITRAQGLGPRRRAISVLGCATPNSAFLGYPILVAVLPDHAGPILAMNLLIENVLLTPIGLTLLESAKDRDGPRPSLPRMARDIAILVLRRPLIIGLLLGLVFILIGIELPPLAGTFLGLMGDAAAPIALFVIGGTLYGLDLKGEMGLAAQITSVKLLVHPLLVAAALTGLVLLGLPPMDPDLTKGLILSATMPMFAIFILFGQEAGYEGLTSLSVMVATCCAFVTINIALLLLI